MVEVNKLSDLMDILSRSFSQLMVIYAVLIFLVTLGIISKYTLHFQLFALILGIIGVIIIREKENVEFRSCWMILPIFVASMIRIMPYIDNNIPLGYDPGIYKYIIEKYWEGLPKIIPEDLDNWIKSGHPPGLFILTTILHLYGFNSFNLYVYLFIFFNVLIALGIYVACKEIFCKEVAIIASFFFSVSIVQFQTFWFFYYKNVLAIFLALLALYLLKSRKYIPLILIGAVVGAIHRPTFLIFIIAYLLYMIVERNDLRQKLLCGLTILALALAFYVPAHIQAILQPLKPLIELEIGPGTFISFYTYQYSSLYYLPLAIIGMMIAVGRGNINPILFWALITGVIVYFKIIFFNRFIIHLDVAIIMLAGAGFYYLLRYNKKVGMIALMLLASSSFWSVYKGAMHAKPLIDDEELSTICSLKNIEEDAYVMAVTSYYSPWLLGYSGKKVIAPGLFDYNRWNYSQWRTFWRLNDGEKAAEMLSIYRKPIYIYIGKNDRINEEKFKHKSFKKILDKDGMKIYRFGGAQPNSS